MASNLLLKFDGIAGESTQANYNEWIECNSLSFGIHAPVNISGTGLGSGKGTPTSYNLTTEMGAHSPELAKKMLEGKHHTTISIKALKNTGADTLEPYWTLDGMKGYIENISWNAGPDGKMYENISFVLEEHKWEYFKQNTEDGTLASTGAKTYNVQAAQTS